MKSIILFVMSIGMATIAQAQVSKSGQYDLVIGTYTGKDKNNGIHVYSFNSKTGEVAFKTKTEGIPNPSYLAISADKKNVYSVSEAGGENASICAYSFDAASGQLTFLNKVSAGGNGPCYISVNKDKKLAFVGNYGGGSLTAAHIKADGSLDTNIQNIQHEGSSTVKGRQDKPHVHSAYISPDGHYLMVPDLGTDKVNVYKIDESKEQPLSPAPQPFVATKPGSGPRHMAFHPNGKFAYVLLEIEGAVNAYSYKDGKMEPIQSITMLADGFTGKVGAADIHASPDGKFLYASNRGEANDIVIYSIAADGKLTLVGHQSTMGSTPRGFAIDPSGNFLLCGNQESDTVVIFKRDQKTGLLTPTGNKITLSMPVCLKFAAL